MTSLALSGDGTVAVHPLFQGEGDGSIPISPLQLVIGHVDMPLAQALNEHWHSVLPRTELFTLTCMPTWNAFAATHANRFYAVAIWTSPVAANRLSNGWNCLELRRFAIASQAPKNTASRMLRVMKLLIRKEHPHIVRLISYQATEHHAGVIYKAAGWMPMTTAEKSTAWHQGSQRDLRQTTSAVIRWESLV